VKHIWLIIAKALGEKAGTTDRDADRIALVRLVLIVLTLTTNAFIVANAIHHW
jgi:hypothetical protein